MAPKKDDTAYKTNAMLTLHPEQRLVSLGRWTWFVTSSRATVVAAFFVKIDLGFGVVLSRVGMSPRIGTHFGSVNTELGDARWHLCGVDRQQQLEGCLLLGLHLGHLSLLGQAQIFPR